MSTHTNQKPDTKIDFCDFESYFMAHANSILWKIPVFSFSSISLLLVS